MKALMPVAVLMGLVSQHACVDAADTEPELGEHQQAEIIEVHGCRPGSWDIDGVCVEPWPTGGGGGPTGGEGGPTGPGGGGGGGAPPAMDPEPDHNKDRNSCEDWCDWSRRQCVKWCWNEYPDLIGDWNKRRVCFEDRCDNHRDPNIGYRECRLDCQRRFPERPIVTIEVP
jgi:hypothetical protein